MPRQKRPEPKAARRGSGRSRPGVVRTTDWALGRRPAPFTVEQPTPFRPELLVLLDAGAEQMVAIEVVEPALSPVEVAEWASGKLRRGTQVRVDQADLAAALRTRAGEGIRVLDAPTPEIDEALESLQELTDRFPDVPVREPTWADGAASEAKAGFYAAAAQFERSRPWEELTDGHVLSIDVPALGRTGACAVVLGKLGETFGLLLLRSIEDYVAFVRLSDLGARARRRTPGVGVALFSVNFDRPRDLPAGRKLAKEARAHGFVPGPQGRVPYILNTRPDGVSAPPTTDDYRLATACLEAVRRFVEGNLDIFEAPPENRIRQTWTVVMPAGELEVGVTAPPEDLPWRWGEEEPIEGLHARDREEILVAFHAARETEGARAEEADADRWAAQEMLEFKAKIGGSAVDWRPEDIEAYLLEYYPSHGLETAGDDLQKIPARLDAFLGWLGATARGHAARLGAVRMRLRQCRERFLEEASDPARFGPAKTVARAMRQAGVDPTDEAAMERFLEDFNRRVRDDPSLLPMPPMARPAKAWVWDGEGLPPDPGGQCPCGSGRRYRKCCMPR